MPLTRSHALLLLAAAATGCGCLGSAAAAAAVPAGVGFRATVVSVGDGDTLRVIPAGGRGSAPLTIRLACIDAPETAQKPWGQSSREVLQQRLPRGVPVQILPHSGDRFGRVVAEVFRDGNVNLALVQQGQAFAYPAFLAGCDARAYLEAESRARRQRSGVWQQEGGITRPWDFRRRARGLQGSDGRRWRCSEIGSQARAQLLLDRGHAELDGDGDGQACESLP